ncbi:MAG TPA: MBL fold metallo-hydrolase [Trebonia sp.]|jgi:glyoxylase-like metal-dependent hydrolase (beta-lactamase superfamily II)|nr:MBL fold metallo-hydrolase [Trebonia sp.]
MNGTITTIDLSGLKVHVYTPPDESLLVNSTVFELADRLIVVDGQIFQRFAREAGDLIDTLGKPVDRFILTHNHPDHYSGFQHLAGRYPGVRLAALPRVRAYLATTGQRVLDRRRALFGDEVASRVVVPDADIVPGEVVISGVRFLFQEFTDAEADDSLTITLPDHGVALVNDLLASPEHHLLTVSPHFDEWIAVLGKIRPTCPATGSRRSSSAGVGDQVHPVHPQAQPVGPGVLIPLAASVRRRSAASRRVPSPN